MDIAKDIIHRIPSWQKIADIQIEKLAGLTNQNFQVTVGGERFVLRVSGQNAARLGINRLHEQAALQAADVAGIGPHVVAFLLPEGHLVTRWVNGRHWGMEEFRTPQNVRLFTETVKRIHQLPPNGAVFSPFQRVNSFLDVARQFNVPLPPDLAEFLRTMQNIQDDQNNDASNWQCFCHNDLVSVNYLFSEEDHSIIVLDWEFAGWGDRYYDLATLVYTHDSDGPIPSPLEELMLTVYFGEFSPWHKRRLQGMKYMLMLFTGMWGLAQHGMQQAGLIPAVEDFDYLEFSQYLFQHDIPGLQLAFQLML
ncbi:MAG: hypothetical protein CVU39_08155 [Chloroflexi bacterium HGW-Chloroflexi-10]|nr:MAG: hypothetical protein CVU39_08155 [Chloroflexi bacterium HGW-Chloroflexi-10]